MTHTYHLTTLWTGNTGTGTATYRAYSRDHELSGGERPPIRAASDPAFRGDPSRYCPEELLLGALSSCHMLWYLHLCADAGVVVVGYEDRAVGRMTLDEDGGGRFDEAVLRPRVTVAAGSDLGVAGRLHEEAHRLCFIARSVRFPVRWEPAFVVEGGEGGGSEPA